jgi:hypothetical protein
VDNGGSRFFNNVFPHRQSSTNLCLPTITQTHDFHGFLKALGLKILVLKQQRVVEESHNIILNSQSMSSFIYCI